MGYSSLGNTESGDVKADLVLQSKAEYLNSLVTRNTGGAHVETGEQPHCHSPLKKNIGYFYSSFPEFNFNFDGCRVTFSWYFSVVLICGEPTATVLFTFRSGDKRKASN